MRDEDLAGVGQDWCMKWGGIEKQRGERCGDKRDERHEEIHREWEERE